MQQQNITKYILNSYFLPFLDIFPKIVLSYNIFKKLYLGFAKFDISIFNFKK